MFQAILENIDKGCVALNGAAGRMGQAVQALAPVHASQIRPFTRQHSAYDLAGCVGAIDFSLPEAVDDFLQACLDYQCPLVIGVTKLSEATVVAIHRAAESIPILYASNFSMGINLLFAVCQKLCGAFKDYFDFQVTEIHHRYKKDKPSGSALTMQEHLEHHSINMPPIQSVRGGTQSSEHRLLLLGAGETVEFSHRSEGRQVFAQGAWLALEWLKQQASGRLYGMEDIFNGI